MVWRHPDLLDTQGSVIRLLAHYQSLEDSQTVCQISPGIWGLDSNQSPIQPNQQRNRQD